MHIGINAQLLSLSETYRAAGVSNYIHYLLRSLSRIDRHNHYTVYTGSWARRCDASALIPLGQNFRVCPSHAPTHLPLVRLVWEQTIQALRSRHLDVLHGTVHVVPLVSQMPRVVTLHDLSFLLLPEKHLRSKRNYQTVMAQMSMRRATHVIADSEYIRQGIIERLRLPPERVTAVPLAAGEEYRWLGNTTQGQCDIEAFRQKKGLPERYYLYLGTLEPRKNIPVLLRAYAQLHQEGMGRSTEFLEPPKLVVAGPKGWLYEEIFAQVKVLGLEKHVLFPGFIPREELVWWYNAALGFVYLSVHEGFGLPPLQAMSCGVPTIVNNASALPEVIGDAGLCVDASTLPSIVTALRDLANSPDLRTDLRLRGLERAAEFSWDRTARQTLAIYEEAHHGK